MATQSNHSDEMSALSNQVDTSDLVAYLYESQFDNAVGSCLRKGVPREAAEDIVAEAFVKIMEANTISSEDDARQALFGKVKFAVLRWRRDEGNRAVLSTAQDRFDSEYSWDEQVSSQVSDVPLYTPSELRRKEEYQRLKADPVKYNEHLKRSREQQAIRYKNNPEKYRQYWRDYYWRNRSYILARERTLKRKRSYRPKFEHHCERC